VFRQTGNGSDKNRSKGFKINNRASPVQKKAAERKFITI
jgi:hypothetical protein